MAKKKNAIESAPRKDKARSAKKAPPAPEPKTPTADVAVSTPGDPEEAGEGLFPIVGIGASAGGLEAFAEMLQAMPANTGMGFVFVQHLDPKHVSILTELLQRHTQMPVRDATEGVRVEPDHIYVIPRDKHMGIQDGVLTLTPRVNSPVPHMSIDPFLRSLAADQKSKAIGVILSGTASDGALGVMAIKAAGGITFAQSIESAKYDGMPQAAIASGCIDFVLSPGEMAKKLEQLGRHPYISPATTRQNKATAATRISMGLILGLLRSVTGVDFTYYKSNTVGRRILRRMALKQIDNLEEYAERLRRDREEVQALYNDILINVTEFFRDPEVFDLLKKVVFPKIAPDRPSAAPIRIWVPGCASGEEVYSIAIALAEYLGRRSTEANVQIFGTDISEPALEKARSGTYASNIVQDLSAERIQRFFTKKNSSYQIVKRIRDMCVFAKQNLVQDPPFSKLDLISCRNVLIYLGPVLQQRLIPIFHYALNPGGYLLLGSSEAIGIHSELFEVEGKKAKVYRRKATVSRPKIEFVPGEHGNFAGAALGPGGNWSDADLRQEADRMTLGKYGPAGVVVDSGMNVVQFRGQTAPFLEPLSGATSLNLLKLAREGLSGELRNIFYKARRDNMAVRQEGVQLRRQGRLAPFNLEVIPFKETSGREARYLVVFEESPPEIPGKAKDGQPKKKGQPATERQVRQLRQELTATEEYLQSVIEELQASNEELASANEEIQSSNEELQSTNEELETAKEELQSSNEELSTMNEELYTRNSELAQASSDFQNLLGNVNIPIVMVGNDLRIRRFTPVSQRMLNLIPSDTGRPIGDVKLNLDLSRLDREVDEVIETLIPKILEVKDLNGRSYSLRIRPYRTEDNKIDGAVLVLVDLDPERASMEAAAERAIGAAAPDASTDELRAFGAGLLVAQENERRHLALELHDDLNQRLALLELNVETLEKGVQDEKQRKTQLHSLREQIASLSKSLREIAHQLHPSALEHLGLAQAVESFVRDFSARAHIDVRFQAEDLPGSMDPETALCLYRIVQESLRNIAQHAGAKSALVSLGRSGDRIRLRVKDAGLGFQPDSPGNKRGLGLRSMEERARACGGACRIISQPGIGTEVLIEIPEQRGEQIKQEK